ncbi:hypothetical protein QBC43DRAFT_307590 [Cladorrhinum sp. PSN259]|nr:hypothetical protein QBC43DRAFT_307590 [Cladorrhinum sp. PSN259]
MLIHPIHVHVCTRNGRMRDVRHCSHMNEVTVTLVFLNLGFAHQLCFLWKSGSEKKKSKAVGVGQVQEPIQRSRSYLLHIYQTFSWVSRLLLVSVWFLFWARSLGITKTFRLDT